MKYLPFSVIDSAKKGDQETIDIICRHYDAYIKSRCQNTYVDHLGVSHEFFDDELYYHGRNAVLQSIFQFQFREPPADFIL